MSPPRTEGERAVALAAALEFERGCYARAAADAAPHPLGLALRDDAVPRAHVLNMLWVTATSVTADGLLAALEATHAGLGHRKAQIDDDALGAVLAPRMRAAGFASERHLVMALGRPRDRDPAPGLASEVDEANHASLEAAVTREHPHGAEEEVVEQLARARAAIRAAAPGGTRFFAGAEGGTDAAAQVTLLRGQGVAQVEDVATLEAHRGRGLARAVCSAAIDAAGPAALVFLVADDGDWPKDLYAKLGFDPVGAIWAFTREPA